MSFLSVMMLLSVAKHAVLIKNRTVAAKVMTLTCCEILVGLIAFNYTIKGGSAMAGQNGKEIAQTVRTKMAEFKRAFEGIDEESSSQASEGRWSPKQIVSHLCGPEGIGHLPGLRAFLAEDTPLLDLKPENPYWSEGRTKMTLSELLSEFDREYSEIAAFVEGLSEDQLSRKAHIPMLRESSLGEYPTLAQWVIAFSSYHIDFHANHLRKIMQALRIQIRP